jgi:hypothetical protein
MLRAAILVGVPAGLVVFVVVPLALTRGHHHWLCAAVAFALTATPGLITLVATDRLAKHSPMGRVVALVLGPVVRLAVGFGGAAIVFYAAGDTFRKDPLSYWGWLLGVYLVTLVVETVLLGRLETGVESREPERR